MTTFTDSKRSAMAFVCVFAGCASYDGQYWPACPAFAGDTVTLDGERFVWDKFTDHVERNSDGTAINRYPDHPKQGSIKIVGDEVSFITDTGDPLPVMYRIHSSGRRYLLTEVQMIDWQRTGEIDSCALSLDEVGRN